MFVNGNGNNVCQWQCNPCNLLATKGSPASVGLRRRPEIIFYFYLYLCSNLYLCFCSYLYLCLKIGSYIRGRPKAQGVKTDPLWNLSLLPFYRTLVRMKQVNFTPWSHETCNSKPVLYCTNIFCTAFVWHVLPQNVDKNCIPILRVDNLKLRK